MRKKALSRRIVDWYVWFRTSLWYVWTFATIILVWILLNKTGLIVFDNPEMTYLNLLLSVGAELQSILLLVYTQRIAERNDRADAEERANVKAILKKLELIHGSIEDINDEEIDDHAMDTKRRPES